MSGELINMCTKIWALILSHRESLLSWSI